MNLVPDSMMPALPALAPAPRRRVQPHNPHPASRRALQARRQARLRWHGDLRGGLIAGLLTVVSTISYASVAGAPLGPEAAAAAVLAGLMGAMLGGPVATWMGSVPTLVFAPRASVAVVIAAAGTTFAAQHAGQPDALARTLATLSLCVLLAALVQVAMGLLRLGGLIRLIPHPVTAGLTVAIALKLAWSQWPQWLGAAVAGRPDWLAPALTGGATLLAIAWAQWRGRVTQAMLIGLGAGVAAGLATGVLLDAQPHLPALGWAEGPLLLSPLTLMSGWAGRWSVLLSPDLLAFAFFIALINSMETLTSTLTLEDVVARRFDANRALIAGATGSLLSVCAGGLPVAGGAATSVASVRAGASTRMSALVAGLVVAVLAAGCGGLVAYIPAAVVAAIMMMVALGLATAPVLELQQQWRRRHDDPRRVYGDLAVALLVGVLLLATDMLVALLVGLLVATWLALLHMRSRLILRRYDANDAELPVRLRAFIGPAVGRTIHIVEIGQPLFFATVEAALRVIEQPAGSVRFLVVDLTRVGGPDATAARSLSRSCAALQAAGRQLVVVRTVYAAAVDHALSGCPVFEDLESALRHCADWARRIPVGEPVPPLAPDSMLRSSVLRSTGPGTAGPTLQSEVEGELGWFVGPIAPALVRRAASRSKDARDMLRQLAGDLPAPDPHNREPRDSLQFRLEHLGSLGNLATMAGIPGAAGPSPQAMPMPAGMQEALDRVGRELASDLAPILGVLATRVPLPAAAPAGAGEPVPPAGTPAAGRRVRQAPAAQEAGTR
jgi:SulP family sulfate permease